MAIGTPVSLGATAVSGTQATYSHTTIAAVPAGGKVVVGIAWAASGSSGTINSVTVGGNSMSQVRSDIENVWGVELWEYVTPGGLSSGVSVVVDPSSSTCYGFHTHAAYVEDAGDEDGSGNGNVRTSAAETTQAYSSGDVAISGEAVMFEMAFGDGTDPQSSTPTSPTVELNQSALADYQWTAALNYRYETGSGSYPLAGSWGSDPGYGDAVCAVAFGPAGPPPQQLHPDSDLDMTGWTGAYNAATTTATLA